VEISLLANHLEIKRGAEYDNLNYENSALIEGGSFKEGINR
jgi:hypothetical protein